MSYLWPKDFTHREFQVVITNVSEIMTSSILKSLLQPPKFKSLWFFTHFHPKNKCKSHQKYIFFIGSLVNLLSGVGAFE